MSGVQPSAGGNKPYFEQQREALLTDIGVSFEHVLQNINKLNRALEGVIAVGNEFGSVEALWSQFENVMGKEPESNETAENEAERTSQHDDDTTDTIDITEKA